MTIVWKRRRLVPLKVIPTGRPTPLENAVIETPPVMTVNLIRPVSMIPVIVLNRFIFFASHSRTSIWSSRYASISVNFLSDMFLVLVVPLGLSLDKFCLLHCRICSRSLFDSWRFNVLGMTLLLFSSSILKSRWSRCVSSSKNTKCFGKKLSDNQKRACRLSGLLVAQLTRSQLYWFDYNVVLMILEVMY